MISLDMEKEDMNLGWKPTFVAVPSLIYSSGEVLNQKQTEQYFRKLEEVVKETKEVSLQLFLESDPIRTVLYKLSDIDKEAAEDIDLTPTEYTSVLYKLYEAV